MGQIIFSAKGFAIHRYFLLSCLCCNEREEQQLERKIKRKKKNKKMKMKTAQKIQKK